ncbi:BTB/POZ and MATH domain-containing protein 2 [Rhynchospora pubera]|uniref:BTB/POZ and MATH domain-containing protein 2 n=1 Tax=Rhynchospora pubera TaxID=906938 RepID=A0AAV8BQY3_9POAL|nr:BTB/POZ and MATH domain-containing protein 2 [Rhynchospora pubera]
MGSSIEGLFTVEVKKYSELASQSKANVGLSKVGSFERMYYAKYGPFTLGDIKFEIRLYPINGIIECHLCLLSGAEFVKKFSYITLYPDPQSKKWFFGRLINEKDFKPDTIGEGMGVPMVNLQNFGGVAHWKQHANDCMLFKLILGLILDDSKKVPSKTNKPEQAVPHPDVKPSVCSCDLITTLLSGDFADIHFVVDGQTFAAHKAVLAARSSVFRSEFLALQREMGQNSTVLVSIQHVDALSFKYLLHFIYTDSLTPDIDELADPLERYHRLFIAAHRLKIEGLKLICEKKLTGAVTKYILSTLDLIDFQDAGLLKIVQKDCDMKPEAITTTTKVGDRLYGTSISKEHV